MNTFLNTLLSSLPNINFAEKDTAIIEAEVIARFEKELDRPLFPGDPWRQALLAIVYYLQLQRSKIDFTGKQNLLAFSSDGFIQHIAALVGTTMLEPKPAVTKLEFTISTAMPGNTIIRAGKRATAGGSIYFATDENVEIPAGELSVVAPATCTVLGSVGNGFLPGQINNVVDTFPFTCSVRNITVTQGGADKEGIEPFRERTRLAPESWSTAGPYGAYKYWAMTTSQLIIDVEVVSPSPGVVDIVPLLRNGEIPTQPVLDAVYKTCNDDKRRPLTDMVVVRAPEAVKYDISFTYYISRRDAPIAATLVQRVYDAVDRFILWQKTKLGRDITPSTLVEMVKSTGVKRLDMDTILPTFKILNYHELGVADNVNVVYGGLEDD